MPDKSPPRKPSRAVLYAPFIVLLVTVAAWGGGWWWLRGEVFRRMDAGAAVLDDAGYRTDWKDRSLTGFPFRLDLDITAPRLRDKSGWGLDAQRLKAEAYVFAPDHWVIVAPDGVTLERRVGGPVLIGARALRASLSDFNAHPPRLSVEGIGLTFRPGPGGAPVSLTAANELHIHAKAGPNDQGAAYFELDQARTGAAGLLGDLAAGAPATLVGDVIFAPSGIGAGDGLLGALRAFTDAGGQVTVRRLNVQAGPLSADARSGALSLDGDGRLKGSVDVTMRQSARQLTAVAKQSEIEPEALKAAQAVLAAHTQGANTVVTVHFQAGQTTLGPVAIGPSPRIY